MPSKPGHGSHISVLKRPTLPFGSYFGEPGLVPFLTKPRGSMKDLGVSANRRADGVRGGSDIQDPGRGRCWVPGPTV